MLGSHLKEKKKVLDGISKDNNVGDYTVAESRFWDSEVLDPLFPPPWLSQ